jgi:hypothetical protein
MTRSQLHSFFSERGYFIKPNSSAYYTERNPNLRYKVTKIGLRKEVKTAAGWVRTQSGYISQLSLNEQGQLKGLSL